MVPVVPVAEISESMDVVILFRISACYTYCKLCTGHQSITELMHPIGFCYMSSHLPQDN